MGEKERGDCTREWLLNAIVYPLSRSAIADVDGSTIAQCKIEQQRFPVFMPDSIQQEAHQILDTLAFTRFEQCQPLSREFDTIPTRVGLYAFRHCSEGLLYIGKAKNLRDRLRNGHKAFLWGWLDHYNPDDVRIAYVTLNQWQRPGLSYELETLILQATNPPYNVKIPRES